MRCSSIKLLVKLKGFIFNNIRILNLSFSSGLMKQTSETACADVPQLLEEFELN